MSPAVVSIREIQGRLDVEDQQGHRHGEDPVRERLYPVLGEPPVVERRGFVGAFHSITRGQATRALRRSAR